MKNKIALIRPGALGDIIMTLNFIKQLREEYDISYFCHSSSFNILKQFIDTNKIVNLFTLENYKKENFQKTINLIGYPLHEGYPYKKMSNHLLYYFAQEMGTKFTFDDFILDLPCLPEKIKIKDKLNYITFQNKTGWSIYKEWWGWQKLINLIKDYKNNIKIYQIGGPRDPIIENIDGSFCGDTFEQNVAIQAWSKLHLGLDSVFNHTSNIIWNGKGKTKSIVLFGSTQSTASGYLHNINISLNLSCQPCFKENPNISNTSLGICNNPPNQTYNAPQHACMKNITPEMVFELILQNNFI